MKKVLKNPRKCFNCKHGGKQFKVGGVTHLQCDHPKWDQKWNADPGSFHPFDTVRIFGDTCDLHEYNIKTLHRRIKQLRESRQKTIMFSDPLNSHKTTPKHTEKTEKE